MRPIAILLGVLLLGSIAGCSVEQKEAKPGSVAAALNPSCAGLPATCGDGTQYCCESLAVPAGVFNLGRVAGDPDSCACTNCPSSCGGCGTLSCNANESPGTVASVSAFRLDRYEVTVGRFRKWVDVGSPEPAKGAGLHTHLGGGQLAGETGWDTAWPIPTDWDTAL